MSIKLGKGGAMSADQSANHAPFTAANTQAECRPEPLMREREDPKPLPIDQIGPLRAPVAAIAELTGAPIEIAFQSVLATASLAVQHISDTETLSGTAPLSLFLLTVAASGERKSSCDKLATAAIHTWEEGRHVDYLTQRSEFDIAQAAYEQRTREAVKLRASGEPGSDIPTPLAPTPPVVPRKILSDMTYEGLLSHFDLGDPSIGIFADEGGQFFGGHGMGRDNQLKTAAGLSKLWDAAPLNRTRAGSPQATYRHRRGAMHLMIQPGIAESVLRNDVLKDQGLLSRFLIAWPISHIGFRLINMSDDEEEKRRQALDDLAVYQSRISELLQASCSEASPLELRPTVLKLTCEARELLIDFANQIEVKQAPDGALAHITGFASKAAEQAARIAGVLTVFENPDAEHIPLSMMENATGITAWYVSEAQRLLDAGTVDPGIETAQVLLEFLKRKYPVAPFDKRTIVRFGPSSVRDTDTAERALKVLENKGHIRKGDGPHIVNGSNAHVNWSLVRDV